MLTSSQLELLPVIDKTDSSRRIPRMKRGKVDITLSRLRALHEELNRQLYAHATERP